MNEQSAISVDRFFLSAQQLWRYGRIVQFGGGYLQANPLFLSTNMRLETEMQGVSLLGSMRFNACWFC